MSFSNKHYKSDILPSLKKEFGFKNDFQVPKIVKIVINVGIGRLAKESKDAVEFIIDDIKKITGQKPVIVKSYKAIAGFKLKPGDETGIKVTLRDQKMYDFLEKLIKITFPRIRDYRGLKFSSVDNYGNINIGIKEHSVFPEIKIEEIKRMFSVQVSIATTAKNKEEAIALLKEYGIVFEKIENNSKTGA